MPNVTVVIEQPLDWIGAALVPIAAILVSAGIAVWLAYSERRRSERAIIRREVADVIHALSDLTFATVDPPDAAKANDAVGRFNGALNSLAAHVRADDMPIIRFSSAVLDRAVATRSAASLRSTSGFLTGCFESWSRGDLSSGTFARHMPPNAERSWVDVADPGDWQRAVDRR